MNYEGAKETQRYGLISASGKYRSLTPAHKVLRPSSPDQSQSHWHVSPGFEPHHQRSGSLACVLWHSEPPQWHGCDSAHMTSFLWKLMHSSNVFYSPCLPELHSLPSKAHFGEKKIAQLLM